MAVNIQPCDWESNVSYKKSFYICFSDIKDLQRTLSRMESKSGEQIERNISGKESDMDKSTVRRRYLILFVIVTLDYVTKTEYSHGTWILCSP